MARLASAILDRTLDDVVEVSDEAITDALVLCLERTKLLVEGAGAAGLAALLTDAVGGDGPVAVVLSGGNIDATTLISVVRHGLTGRALPRGRLLIPDRPGELRSVLDLVAEQRAATSDRRPPPRGQDDDGAADGGRACRVDARRPALHDEEFVAALEGAGLLDRAAQPPPA